MLFHQILVKKIFIVMGLIEQQSIGITTCLDYDTIINNYNGDIIENEDGTVSVYIDNGTGVTPMILGKSCCEYLGAAYFFDIETQKCRWSTPATCNLQDTFKLVLNPKGNDGEFFDVEDGDTCFLKVDFNYLFKIKCETLNSILNSNSIQKTKFVDPNIDKETTSIQNEINNLTNYYDSLSNQLTEYLNIFNNTSYSIVCNSSPVIDMSSGPVLIKTAGTSAFGNVAPFGFGNTLVIGQIYCINEPDGLNQWRIIIGETNYANFITGEENSYTCSHIQTLFDLNSNIVTNNILNGTKIPELMIACDTPINTKSNLMGVINSINEELTITLNNIESLSSQLNILKSSSAPFDSVCDTPLDFFETFDVSMSIDIVTSANTLETVYTQSLLSPIGVGNLYNYLVANPNSGFFVCGDSDNTPLVLNLTGGTELNDFICEEIRNDLVDGLFAEYGGTDTTFFGQSISPNSFSSNWLNYSAVINNPDIIANIANKKIKISININHTCGDFCVLVDNIFLEKICTHVKDNNIFLTKSPGFVLDRIRDNKKSWVNNTTLANRPFSITNNSNSNNIRQTNYDVNDERLVINSKEIDLDINLANAIETDVWCFISDNPCLLTGVSSCNPCTKIIEQCGNKQFQDDECFNFQDDEVYEFMDGDFVITGDTPLNHSNCCGDEINFNNLLKQPLSAVTTIEDFDYFLTSELIDVKNRQTLSGYPTLRALYDRYMNSYFNCGNKSSKFDYITMDQFAALVGTYWVDIVEQVIPATTIWGSTKIYSNSIFDQQKFKYRGYTTLLCNNPYNNQQILSPINGTIGKCVSVEVAMTNINQNTPNAKLKTPVTTYCNSLCVAQMSASNEFIGKISIVGVSSPNCDTSNGIGINENTLQANVVIDYPLASVNLVGATQPISYLWSDGSTSETATFTPGEYTVTITDGLCNQLTLEFTMITP